MGDSALERRYELFGLEEEDYISNYDEYIRIKDEFDRFDFDFHDDYLNTHGVRWKVIPGFSNYIISEDGIILSYKKNKKPHLMKYYHNKYGHLYVDLIDDYGERRKLIVHRLVAKTFIRNKRNFSTVMHMDDNPINNNIYNLRWGTPYDNVRDCINKGRNYTRKVYCYDTDRVYNSCLDAAEDLGVSKSLITVCCQGKVHSVNGMIFCYLEDKKNMSSKERNILLNKSKGYKPVRATNIRTGQSMVFKSRREASRCLDIPDCGISSCITGHLKHTHGWRFENLEGDDIYE